MPGFSLDKYIQNGQSTKQQNSQSTRGFSLDNYMMSKNPIIEQLNALQKPQQTDRIKQTVGGSEPTQSSVTPTVKAPTVPTQTVSTQKTKPMVQSVAQANRIDPVVPQKQTYSEIGAKRSYKYDLTDPVESTSFVTDVIKEYNKKTVKPEQADSPVFDSKGAAVINEFDETAKQQETPDLVLTGDTRKGFDESLEMLSGAGVIQHRDIQELKDLMDESGNNYTAWQNAAYDKGYTFVKKSGWGAAIERAVQNIYYGATDALQDAGTVLQTSGADKPLYNDQITQLRALADDPNIQPAYKASLTSLIHTLEYQQAKIAPERLQAATGIMQAAQESQATGSAIREAQYDLTDFQKKIGDLAYQGGQMIPSIAAAYITWGAASGAGLGPTITKLAADVAGYGVLGAQVKGDTMQSALASGADWKTAEVAGNWVATIEVATELLSGGIQGSQFTRGLSGWANKKVLSTAIGKKMMSSTTGKFLLKTLINSGFEMGEEVAAGLIEPYVIQATYDPSYPDPTIQDILQQATDAGILSVFLGTAGVVRNIKMENVQNAQSNINQTIPDEQVEKALNTLDETQGTVQEQTAEQPKAEQVIPSQPVERATTGEVQNGINTPVEPQNVAQRGTAPDNMQSVAQEGTSVPVVTQQPKTSVVSNLAEQTRNTVTLSTPAGEFTAEIASQQEVDAFKNSDRKIGREISNAQEVARITGVNLQFANNIKGETNTIEGYYDPSTKTATVSFDAQNILSSVLSHEVVHSLKGTTAYNELVDYVVERAKTNGTYNDLLQQSQNIYKGQSTEYLHDELAGDAVAELFNDPREVRRFINAHRGVVGKILNALDTIIGKLTGRAKIGVKELRDKFYAATKIIPVKQTDTNVRASVRSNSLAQIKMDTSRPRVPKNETLKKEVDIWTRRLVNSGAGIQRIANVTNDPQLWYSYDWVRRARAIGENMIGESQFDLGGENKIGDGLVKILDPLYKRGDEYTRTFFEYLLHEHNIDRMAQDKPVFGVKMTAETSSQIAGDILKTNPEFNEYANKIYKFLDNLMQMRVDSGLISQGQADAMRKMYPHYVPTFRDMTSIAGSRAFGNTVSIKSGIMAAKGSNLDIVRLDVSIARQAMQTAMAAKRNEFGNLLHNNAVKNGRAIAGDVEVIEKVPQKPADMSNDEMMDVDGAIETTKQLQEKQSSNLFTIYNNGQKITMRVSDSIMGGLRAISAYNQEHTKIGEITARLNKLFKQGVTGMNPKFMYKNAVRDIQEALIYTQAGIPTFIKNYVRAFKGITTNSTEYQQYKARGGLGVSFFDYNQGIKTKPSNAYKYTLGGIESLNAAVEAAPRFAEYLSIIEKEGNSYEATRHAMNAAAEVTANFAQSGETVKKWNATWAPFLNPGVQGTYKAYQTFSGKRGKVYGLKVAARAFLLGVGPTILARMLMGRRKDYDQLPDYVKWGNYVFPIGDGKFIFIPRGRIAATFATGADAVMSALEGEQVDWVGAIEFAVDQTAPANPITSNLLYPIYGAITNKTWYGGEIDPQWMVDTKKPGERYDESTDALSKWIGETLNISPKRISYVIDAYTGILGDLILPTLTPQAEANMLNDTFVVDSVLTNKLPGEFYDQLQNLAYLKNEDGAEPYTAYVYSYMNKQADQISEINKEIRKISNASWLSDEDKREQIRNLRRISNKLMEDTLNALPMYTDIAMAVNPDIKPGEKGGSAITARIDYQAFGPEYALKNYDKDVYAKAQDAREVGVSYDGYYNAYFSIKDIQSTYPGSENTEKRRRIIYEYVRKNFDTDAERKVVIESIGGYKYNRKYF